MTIIPSKQASFVITNVSHKAIRVLGRFTLKPGQRSDLFTDIDDLKEEEVAWELLYGDLHNEIINKHTLYLSDYYLRPLMSDLTAVNTLADRDAIPVASRIVGLTVFVKSELAAFELVSGITNSDWSPSRVPMEGNTIFVDAVYGNDAGAAVGNASRPYLTVEAAIAAASAGDLICVRAGTYTLSAGITIPANTSIHGTAHQITVIEMTNVTSDTTLVTMGENSSVNELTFRVTSAEHHNLTCVLFPGLTTSTCLISRCNIEVDNSGASDGGTSDGYGIRIAATSTPVVGEDHACISDCLVSVNSAGSGTKRALFSGTSLSNTRTEHSIFACSRTGAGAGSYIGVEVNFTGSKISMNAGACSGTSADMSQTLGTLEIFSVELTHDNANGKGFTVTQACPRYTWGISGAIPNGVTRFLYPGTAAESANEIFNKMPSKCIVKSISVRARVAPGVGVSDVFTLRKNGVDTAITATLSGTNTSALTTNTSVSFAANDDLSMKIVTGASSATNDVIIIVELY